MDEGNPLRDKSNYQGRKLALLVVSIAIPSLFYYLRLALAFSATRAPVGSAAYVWLMRGSTAALLLFFVAQIAAGWHLRRLFRKPGPPLLRALQIAGIIAVCGAFSIGAAVLAESFAYEMLIRSHKMNF